MYKADYTFTPTEQKRATTPKPPRMLAVEATAASRTGRASFGRLRGIDKIVRWYTCNNIRGLADAYVEK